MKSIVICEKPSQARNVRDALGSEYGQVLAARGHIFKLAEPHEVKAEWKPWTYDVLRPDSGFYPLKPDTSYGKDKVIDEFKAALSGADRVIIATDCDREGQAIGENIVRFFKFKGDVFRAMFNAEDPASLRDAFGKMQPNKVYLKMYQAAFARMQSDQICNLSMTRAVTLAVRPVGMEESLGIGRVKTPTMGIVCRREREINNFEPNDFFIPWMDVSDGLTTVRLKAATREDARILDADKAKDIVRNIDGWSGPIIALREQKSQLPPKLMDLPTLQKKAAQWGWAAKKVLDTAQALYETHKITTYPRAENRYLPENEIANADLMLSSLKELDFVKVSYDMPVIRKGKSGTFSDKQLEGSSHHAIVPNVKTQAQWAAIFAALDDDERKLFELIASSYVAAIGPDRVYDRTEMKAAVGDYIYGVNGNVDVQLGWKEALGADVEKVPSDTNDTDQSLPDWNAGQIVSAAAVGLDKKTTKAPARYTEGSLVSAMQQAWKFAHDGETAERLKDSKGIGTVATRDTIIEGLKKQGFFEIVKNQIVATDLALALYDVLMIEAPEIVDPAATAVLELALDDILTGKSDPQAVIDMLVNRAAAVIVKMKIRGEKGQPLDVKVHRKPSPKMLDAARAKAKRENVKLPRGAVTDFDICKEFLGPLPDNDLPSEAQIKFAQKIAGAAQVNLDEETLQNRALLSAWINANKDVMPSGAAGGDGPPTAKQIGFAEKIAKANDLSIPAATLQSRGDLSKWIDKNSKKRKRT